MSDEVYPRKKRKVKGGLTIRFSAKKDKGGHFPDGDRVTAAVPGMADSGSSTGLARRRRLATSNGATLQLPAAPVMVAGAAGNSVASAAAWAQHRKQQPVGAGPLATDLKGDSEPNGDATPMPPDGASAVTGSVAGAEEELRIDPSEGTAFTKAEFEEYYGGTEEWDAAEVYHEQPSRNGPQPPAPAPAPAVSMIPATFHAPAISATPATPPAAAAPPGTQATAASASTSAPARISQETSDFESVYNGRSVRSD